MYILSRLYIKLTPLIQKRLDEHLVVTFCLLDETRETLN